MKKFHKVALLCIFAACVCAILFLSGQDGEEAFDTTYGIAKPIADVIYNNPTNDQIEDIMIIIRNLGRVVAFTVFGILLTLNIEVFTRFEWKVKVMLVVVISILFSVFDEVHKLLIDGRHCTLAEILVNIICSMLGGLLVCFIRYKWCQKLGQVAKDRDI